MNTRAELLCHFPSRQELSRPRVAYIRLNRDSKRVLVESLSTEDTYLDDES